MSNPPRIEEHHVRLPDQVAGLLGASSLHSRGITGKGIRVAIIDSGFFPHPFYENRGYRIQLIPTHKEPFPDQDEYGHGTAQLASLLSIAPEAEVLAIKCMDRDPSYALKKAIALKPHVLCCAWGFNIDHKGVREVPEEFRSMHRILRKAVKDGICVVAAAGNGQHAFPGSMPEVISSGGVYFTADGKFTPSDVSSFYESSIFPKRRVPDICGLSGNLPHGRLLLVPVPPKARLARRAAFGAMMAAEGESIKSSKAVGWALFSGTSAATAMISGAAALLLQIAPELSPEQIRELLMQSGKIVEGDGERVLDASAAVDLLGERLQVPLDADEEISETIPAL